MASNRDRVYLTYGSVVANDRLLRIDFQDPGNPEFATSTSAYTTLASEEFTNTVVAGTAGGDVFTLDTGDGGTAKTWSLKTKAFPLGSPSQSFAVESVVIDADLAGIETSVTVTSDHDGELVSQIYTIPSTVGSGRKRHHKRLPPKMKGGTASVAISSSSSSDRYFYGGGFVVESLEMEEL